MKMNSSLAEKYRASSRKVFTKIGDLAIGNGKSKSKPAVAFSLWPHWMYEIKMPKRKK